MSYEIVYERIAIKHKDKILPIILWGSNNCWDSDGRRERNFDSPIF